MKGLPTLKRLSFIDDKSSNVSSITAESSAHAQPRCDHRLSHIHILLKKCLAICIVFGCYLNLVQLGLPLFSMQIFDRVLPSGQLPTLYVLAGLLVFITVSATVVDASKSMIMSRSAQRFASIVSETYSKSSQIDERVDVNINSDVNYLRIFLSGPVIGAVLDIPWAFVYVAVLSIINAWLGVFSLCAIIFVVAATEGGRLLTQQERSNYQDGERNLEAALSSLKDQRGLLLGLGILPRALQRINRIRIELLTAHGNYHDRSSWTEAFTKAIRTWLQLAVMTLSATLAVKHSINAGAIVASTMLFTRALSPFERLAVHVSSLRAAVSCWRRTTKYMNSAQQIPEKMRMPFIRGQLRTRDVVVQGDTGRKTRLSNVTFSADPGELHVILGDEGAGKSTFAELLCGALEPVRGTVLLDGMSLSNYDELQLASQIGYLPEYVAIQTGTIADIIGREIETDHEAVVLAATMAGIDELIRGLPAGYQTELRGSSRQLSTGQAKRLAFARAIYGLPQILILDEPLSGLDSIGESFVISSIQALKKRGATIVIISKSSLFLPLADRAWVLAEGKLAYALDGVEMRSHAAPKGVTH